MEKNQCTKGKSFNCKEVNNLKSLMKLKQFKNEENQVIGKTITDRKVQANKSIRRMPWHQEPMKDVISCDKLRGAANKRYIRRFPNVETLMAKSHET